MSSAFFFLHCGTIFYNSWSLQPSALTLLHTFSFQALLLVPMCQFQRTMWGHKHPGFLFQVVWLSVGWFFEFWKNHWFWFLKIPESKNHWFWFFEKLQNQKKCWFWLFQNLQELPVKWKNQWFPSQFLDFSIFLRATVIYQNWRFEVLRTSS